ncbi:hypothetical protein MKP05_08105 [Halomonas sp. EGI 63088]|uniref:Uncharacterized protein n=1 Tax=Halomonas flagellata TaxID=2920385 RepID=A0ABS9RTB4_9GAMM|nr:hypothetical protein [Halomonas flagellata]MCH4563090.1 hypothetical protein [Halomonas flagellata]
MTSNSRPGSLHSPLILPEFQLPAYEGGREAPAPMACEAAPWADILYLTGTGTFWLLTEEVADALHEAAEELAGWVKVEDPIQRMEHLSKDAGVMECFLPARPENFLDEAEREQAGEKLKRLGELMQERGDEEADPAQRVSAHTPLSENPWFWVFPFPVGASRLWNWNDEETRLVEELHVLYRRGMELAREEGYVIEGGGYYGPWEAEIESALETYRQRRATIMRTTASVDQPGALLPVREALVEYQAFLADCESMSPRDSSRCTAIGEFISHEAERLDADLRAYCDSILALATLGVATPEWALADAPANVSGAGLEPGIEAFDHYNRVLQQAADLFGEVEAKLGQWATATAHRSALPIHLFEAERQAFNRLVEQLDVLYQLAEAQVQRMRPQRVLFWQADIDDQRHALGYQRQTIDVLVRKDFPLREFSSPRAEQALSHVSLRHLMQEVREADRPALLRDLEQDGVLPATLWEANETALSNWLARRGCERIERRAEWFEERLGFFVPDAFFTWLEAQGHEVASLQQKDAKRVWAETLQRILFTGPSRERLRLFDASAQAQMLRLVGMPHASLNDALDTHLDEPVTLIEREASLELFEWEEKSKEEGSVSAQMQQRREVAGERNIGGPRHGPWRATEGSSSTPRPSAGAKYQLELKGTYSLARGEISLGTLHLPHESDAVPFAAVLTQRQNELRDLGCYSLQVVAVAKGFAGATLAMTAETGLGFDHNGVKLTGLEWAQREAQGATLKAFAGATVGVNTRCSMRWQPPADITRQLPQLADRDWLTLSNQQAELTAWRTLGHAVLGLEAAGGIGGELGLRLGIHQGKFVAYFKGRVVAGKGVGGQIAMELDLQQLNLWLMMLSQALRDNDYGFIDWVDRDAFEGMSRLAYLATTTLLDVGLLAAQGLDGIQRLYDLMTQSERAGMVAHAIVNDPRRDEMCAWIQHLPPEALGPLLNTLATPPGWRGYTIDGVHFDRSQATDLQQIAIANCLGWLEDGYTASGHYDRTKTQHLFERAVARMSMDGTYDRFQSWVQAYCHNRERLDQFMKQIGSTGLAGRDAAMARDKYRLIANRMGTDIDEYRQVVSTRRGTRIRYEER